MALKTKENSIQSNLITKKQSQIQQNKKRSHKKSQSKPELKVRRRKDQNSNYTQSQSISSISGVPNISMATFYPPVYPIINEWSPIFPIQCPVAVPIIVNAIPVTQAPIFQYITPVVSPHIVDISPVTNYNFEEIASPIDTTLPIESTLFIDSVLPVECTGFETPENEDIIGDPIEFYLSLPKDLFPSARMLSLDPNIIIDEFCKLSDFEIDLPWVLDLEFGVPKIPITRPIPIYNVKLNSINCKNTPDAIHPGFEACNEDFKKVLLFYYDCIVSSWYRGYIVMNSDKSVDNFQSWLLQPMQELGMCWS